MASRRQRNGVKTVIRPAISPLVNVTETWLAQMAKDGYRLEKMTGWQFTFRKGAPKERMYFMHRMVDRGMGFFYDFRRAREQFADRQSPLAKDVYVFEVDPHKADETFAGYVKSRNRFYFWHYVWLSLLSAAGLVVSFCAQEPLFAVVWVLILAYGVTSASLIKLTAKNKT
jgi:hypothetical protein